MLPNLGGLTMSRIKGSLSAAILMIAFAGCGELPTEEPSNDSPPDVSTRRPADAAADASGEAPSEAPGDAPSAEAPAQRQNPRATPAAPGSPRQPSAELSNAPPAASPNDVPANEPNDIPVAQPTEPSVAPAEPPVEPSDPPVAPVQPPPVANRAPDCSVPAEAQEEDSSRPDIVIGNGTPQSCTSDAFVEAVARGGVITFDCGPAPVVITLDRTAKVFNDQNPDIVIDGGGKVTLSGGGRVRILYQNTCNPDQVWTTSHCDDQDHPRLTVQNLTFIDGNAKSQDEGGGAIFVRGGRFKAVNTQFFDNVCDDEGPDVGGGAIRVFDQYQDRPVYIVNSRFGAEGRGNICSNGGALSSIGVSYTVLNSSFTHNQAIGYGANPQRSGTPGGGSGGAIYNDGNTFTLKVCGSYMANNTANEGGGAIFFVSNDLSGRLVIEESVLEANPSDGFETQGYPGIFVLAAGEPRVSGSTLLR